MAWKRHLLKTFLKQHKKEKQELSFYYSYCQFTFQIWLKNQLVWPTNYYFAFTEYFKSPMYCILWYWFQYIYVHN